MPHSLTSFPEGLPLVRVTRRAYRTLHTTPKPVVVKLLASDELEFSELRGRHKYRVPVAAAFLFAIRLAVTTGSRQPEIL